MKQATKHDAEILLSLYQTFNTPQMRESMNWFAKDFSAKDFKEFKTKYPMHSAGAEHVSRILTEYEVAGALVSHGLLNENLYFDVSGIGFAWEKLGPIIAGWQKEAGPQLWENAVWLAARHKKWLKNVWKPNLKWKLK